MSTLMNAHCPHSISSDVVALCRKINAQSTPLYVPLAPEVGCQPLDCFINVRKKVNTAGGEIKYGWAIWQHGKYFIEAEHHCVYQSPSNSSLVDITPRPYPAPERTLFLPDENAAYDYDTDQLRENITLPLLDDSRLREMLRLISERVAILNSVPGFGNIADKLTPQQILRLGRIEQQNLWLASELASDYEGKVGRNDPCPCGSGKKFKKCCGT